MSLVKVSDKQIIKIKQYKYFKHIMEETNERYKPIWIQ